MHYAVCTHCTFLRAYSERAAENAPPERCPACGSSVLPHESEERFPPAYVARVSLALNSAPPLQHDAAQ